MDALAELAASAAAATELPASTLLPVRLDLDEAGWSLHDGILWPSDASMSVMQFVRGLVRDTNLPDAAVGPVAQRMKEQVQSLGAVWANKRAQLAAGQAAPLVRRFNLEVKLGATLFRDCFEWDIHNLATTPEEFMQTVAHDVGLTRAQQAAVAHHFRRLLFTYWSSSLAERVEATGGANAVRVGDTSQWQPRLEPVLVPASASAAASAAAAATGVDGSADEQDDGAQGTPGDSKSSRSRRRQQRSATRSVSARPSRRRRREEDFVDDDDEDGGGDGDGDEEPMYSDDDWD